MLQLKLDFIICHIIILHRLHEHHQLHILVHLSPLHRKRYALLTWRCSLSEYCHSEIKFNAIPNDVPQICEFARMPSASTSILHDGHRFHVIHIGDIDHLDETPCHQMHQLWY